MNRQAKILFKKGKKLEAQENNIDAISVYEEALGHSPQNPDILFAIGNVAKRMGMLQIAEKMYREVYGFLPDSVEAATNLAIVINDQDRTDEAIGLYKSILAVHPEHAGTWINIGNAVAAKDDLETAEIFYNEALRLKPGSVEALISLAELMSAYGNYDEALRLTEKALKRDKKNPFIRYNRGEYLLALGQLKEGWSELNYGILNRKDRRNLYNHKLEQWKGEDLAGKKILLSCEQGIGDQVRYLNCVNDVIKSADHVVIETDTRLVNILARTFPEATVRAFNCEKVANVTHFNYSWPVNELDYASSMLGLYQYLKTEIESFNEPHRVLVTDEELNRIWKERTSKQSNGLKVGICWRGGKRSSIRDLNYTNIGEWGPILTQRNTTFFSLMYDECDEEIDEANTKFGVNIVKFDDLDYMNDVDDVFSLTQQMDMVISVNSAPASFSSVLAIPTYVPSRISGWDTLGTDRQAMVPAMTLFTQKSRGDWAAALKDIAEVLSVRLKQFEIS